MMNSDGQIHQMNRSITDLVGQVAQLNEGMDRIMPDSPAATTDCKARSTSCKDEGTQYDVIGPATDSEPICPADEEAIGWRGRRGSNAINLSRNPCFDSCPHTRLLAATMERQCRAIEALAANRVPTLE
eukprot:Filipodium_phascolosomae@DN8811_c0_g1_i1.p1